MLAAIRGHAECVPLLIPVSELGAQGENRATASEQARGKGYSQSADLIDAYAYALAQSERLALKRVHRLRGSTPSPTSTRMINGQARNRLTDASLMQKRKTSAKS